MVVLNTMMGTTEPCVSVIIHLNLNHVATTGRQEVTIAAIFFRQYAVYNIPDDEINPLELELIVQYTLYRPWI
jgi:hypothetical protein